MKQNPTKDNAATEAEDDDADSDVAVSDPSSTIRASPRPSVVDGRQSLTKADLALPPSVQRKLAAKLENKPKKEDGGQERQKPRILLDPPANSPTPSDPPSASVVSTRGPVLLLDENIDKAADTTGMDQTSHSIGIQDLLDGSTRRSDHPLQPASDGELAVTVLKLERLVSQLQTEISDLKRADKFQQSYHKRISQNTTTGSGNSQNAANGSYSTLGDSTYLGASAFFNSKEIEQSNNQALRRRRSLSDIIRGPPMPVPSSIVAEKRITSSTSQGTNPATKPRSSLNRFNRVREALEDTLECSLRENDDDVVGSLNGDTDITDDGNIPLSKKSDAVFIHPEEIKAGNRTYTPEELEKIKVRPFPSRMFVTNIQVDWNTVWLRTRHTDDHAHRSSFILIRDAFKADAITNNPPAAKYALTELLNMCYGMRESDYYSFACSVASAFSSGGSNIEFEKNLLLDSPDLKRKKALKEAKAEIGFGARRHLSEKELEKKLLQHEQRKARERMIILLHIVFSKLRQKKILVDDNKHNIYRIVLCLTKHRRSQWPMFYAWFSFFFQMCAGMYVALSLTMLDDTEKWYEDSGLVGRNIALALGTLSYGLMVAYPEVISTREVFRCLYQSEISWLAAMDFLVNLLLPVAVAVCGFFVVLSGATFLEGVLNSVALIFIAEIDDHLPRLLELDILDIVQGFLIDQAMEEYQFQDTDNKIAQIEFSDMILTNTPEGGSIASKGITFQPYEVFGDPDAQPQASDGKNGNPLMPGGSFSLTGSFLDASPASRKRRPKKKMKGQRTIEGDDGQQVANKRSVTADCLLRKIEWQYTSGYDDTCEPRIGHLRLTKLMDRNKIDIRGKNREEDISKRPFYSVTGVFIITSFSMSDDVLRLRICGSPTKEHFLKAFRYYGLWPLDPTAEKILRRGAEIKLSKDEDEDNKIVFYGGSPRGAVSQAVPPNSGDPTIIITNGTGIPTGSMHPESIREEEIELPPSPEVASSPKYPACLAEEEPDIDVSLSVDHIRDSLVINEGTPQTERSTPQAEQDEPNDVSFNC